MTITLNGSTGVTTPGLASTAMPTSGGDPVVESGSNSDGRWWRAADGTQQCFVRKVLNNIATSNIIIADWTFPSAFIDSNVIVIHTPDQGTSSDAPNIDTSRRGYAQVLAPTSTGVSLRNGCSSADSYGAGNVINTHAVATGRWK